MGVLVGAVWEMILVVMDKNLPFTEQGFLNQLVIYFF